MNTDKVSQEIIIGYRKLVEERYQFNKLIKKYDLPETVTEDDINNVRDYFLTYVYPDIAQRKELDEAFKTLDGYIKKPEKLLNILLDSFKLIFSHGKHLPKIFGAGLQAMKSFRGATKFEKSLTQIAIDKKVKYPYSSKKINGLIKELPYKEVQEFIKNTEAFFNIIYDKILVEKIKEVIAHIIAKMKKKPKLFTSTEIKGLELALETIEQGERILDTLSQEEQEILVEFVVKIEKQNLEEIYSS